MGIETALGWAMSAGLSAFLPVFIIGCVARFTDWVTLPNSYLFIQSDWFLITIGILTFVELIADKIPVVDHAWDSIQTVVRPIAGAVLATAAIGAVRPEIMLLAAVLGGGLATTVHTSKSSLRLMSTSTTGGFLNPLISLFEDILAIIGTFLSIFSPLVMVTLAIILMIFAFWLLPKVWGFVVFRFMMWFSWFKWLFAKPKLDLAKPPYLYRTSQSKLDLFQPYMKGEKAVASVQGQVWLNKRNKIIWLVLTEQSVKMFAKGVFTRENLHFYPKDIVTCHLNSEITMIWDLVLKDQVIKFEFFKSTEPYIRYIHDTVQQWIREAHKTEPIQE